MRKTVSALALAELALMPVAPAQAQDAAAVFKPSGNWVADYGDDYCRLMRPFNDGKSDIALGLERIRPGAQTRLILVGNGVKTFRGADQLGYAFAPTQAEREARYVRSETADGKQYLNLGPVTLAAGGGPGAAAKYDRAAEQVTAKAITAIALAKGMTTPIRIETGALDAPIAALQACADDLVKSWGVDPLATQAVAKDNGSGWLPQGTIPAGEFAKFGGGANQVLMLVDATGKPTKCQPLQPSLSAALNEKICKVLMEKAQFTPGKNPAGEAVASYWIGNPQFLGPPLGGGRGRGGGTGAGGGEAG
jgi:hypothetical protein